MLLSGEVITQKIIKDHRGRDLSHFGEQNAFATEESHEELYQVHKIAVLGEGNLNFDGPGEITDINKESDIWVVAKIKLLIRETIFVLLNVGF